jgi:hypothetical protein
LLVLLHFSHDRSSWFSLSSSTTFQTVSPIRTLLHGVS